MQDYTNKTSRLGRRNLLRGLLGGGAGLAAIATGLSPAFLRAPLAHAGGGAPGSAQFLILSASNRGDPMNANCPGSYAHAGIRHPDAPEFAGTPIQLGGASSTAAQIWGTLPQWVLDRSCFIHHATRSAVHSEMAKILRLMGATEDEELLPSLIAAKHAPILETIQRLPVNVGRYVELSAEGVALPRLQPTALKQLLTASNGPLADLRSVRDQHVDAIHAILKENGTREQRRYLDARAQSREDARKLADDAASIFAMVEDDSALGELLAALALFRLRVTPVATVSLPFGGDNHSDVGFQEEIDQHSEGIATIAALMSALESTGMKDQVTLATLNVFGRNLVGDPAGGRDHWAMHAVSLLIGPCVRGGVVGGIELSGDDFVSAGIKAGGVTVPFEETLVAVGKTIWAAAGGDGATIEAAIPSGVVLDSALA
jgi:hypothetical protein